METYGLRDKLLELQPVLLDDCAELIQSSFPELWTLRNTRHPDGDAWQHTQEVLQEAQSMLTQAGRQAEADTVWPYVPSPAPVYLAALVHDLGRGIVTGSELADNPPGHASHGVAPAREVLRRLHVPFLLREAALQLVRHHHAVSHLGASATPETEYVLAASQTNLMWIYEMAVANARARRHPPKKVLDAAESFRRRATGMGLYNNPPLPVLPPGVLEEERVHRPETVRFVQSTLLYMRLAGELADEEAVADAARRLLERHEAPTLGLLVGIPGSGKSLWVQKEAARARLVSTDALREVFSGDASDQSRNAIVFRKAARQIRESLAGGEDVFFDATNCDHGARKMPVRAARHLGARIAVYFVDVPLSLALERNGQRDRNVPDEVVFRFYRSLEPPALHEADAFWRVDERGELERIF